MFFFFFTAFHSLNLLFKVFFVKHNQINGSMCNMIDHYYLNDYSKSSDGVTLKALLVDDRL